MEHVKIGQKVRIVNPRTDARGLQGRVGYVVRHVDMTWVEDGTPPMLEVRTLDGACRYLYCDEVTPTT